MDVLNTSLNNNIKDELLNSSRVENTNKLKSIPGLSESIVLSLGNCIFIPGLPEDYGKIWSKLIIDIDGKPQIFCKLKNTVNRHSGLSVVLAESFDYEGAEYIFRHTGGIPIIYKQLTFKLALYRNDPNILSLAYTINEQTKLMDRLGHGNILS